MADRESDIHQPTPTTATVHTIRDEVDDILTFCSARDTAEEAMSILTAEYEDEAYYLRSVEVHTSAERHDPRKADGLWTVTHPWTDNIELYLDYADAQAEAAAIELELQQSEQPKLSRCRPVWHQMHHGEHVAAPEDATVTEEALTAV